MFGATLNLYVLDYSFGALKDSGLKSNRIALNNCFSYRNVFQNVVKLLSKFVLKQNVFFFLLGQKAETWYGSDHTILFKFYQHMYDMVQMLIK